MYYGEGENILKRSLLRCWGFKMAWAYLLFASMEKIFFKKDIDPRISTIIIQKIKSASFASSFLQSLNFGDGDGISILYSLCKLYNVFIEKKGEWFIYFWSTISTTKIKNKTISLMFLNSTSFVHT